MLWVFFTQCYCLDLHSDTEYFSLVKRVKSTAEGNEAPSSHYFVACMWLTFLLWFQVFQSNWRKAAEGQGLQSLWQPETRTVWLIILCMCPYVFVFALALATEASFPTETFLCLTVKKHRQRWFKGPPGKFCFMLSDHINKIDSVWLF